MTGKRVLVVEDDADTAAFLRELLHVEGCDVRHAANGAEALAVLATPGGVRYDVVLLDWDLPFYPGGELLSLIRRSSQVSGLPVVVLTGSASPDDREAALALGVSAFLTKPSSVAQVKAALEKAIAEGGGPTPDEGPEAADSTGDQA